MTGPATPRAPALAELLEREHEKLLGCVHCGFCLPVCPTYTRLGDEADSPRGRLYLMRALVEGRIDAGSDAFQTHMDRCLGCRACETVCPSGVEYGQLLEGARHAAIRARPLPFPTRLMLKVFSTASLRRPALAVGRLLRVLRVPKLLLMLVPRLSAFRSVRLALAMLAGSAPARLRTLPGLAEGDRDEGASSDPESPGLGTTAGVLTGCVQEGLFGRVNGATERTLAANGYELRSVGGQGCCGALHAHAGDIETARELARVNVRAFEAAGVGRIAVNAAGCGAAMREYGHLLADDAEYAERAETVAERVRDVAELLAETGPRPGAGLAARVTYDAPCHLHHGQRVTKAPLRVLAAVPGLELMPLSGAEECCGGAGIYGLTHPELGARIGGDKVQAIQATGAELVATGNPGCMMQIGAGFLLAGSSVRAVHPVELLDESYRRAGLYRGAGRVGDSSSPGNDGT